MMGVVCTIQKVVSFTGRHWAHLRLPEIYNNYLDFMIIIRYFLMD